MTEATQQLLNRPTDAPGIVPVRNTVHVAVACDASYMAMIVGADGIVLVDTGSDPQRSSAVMAKFRALSDKPLKAVILTHSHPDHTGGLAGVLGAEAARDPGFKPENLEIWAREGYGSEFALGVLLPQIFALRGGRQFGAALPPEQFFPPLGPRVLPDLGEGHPVLEGRFGPNRFFGTASHTLDVAGLTLELHAAPGETSDQLFVWMPESKIVFIGDNMYGSFPNLYAVRGAGYRDVNAWARSVKAVADKKPEAVVMGHSAPLTTRAECEEWLGHYHEAIRYVFDTTIAGMNQGLTADELAASVALPEHLAGKPYLQQYYGNVAFAVRSIFAGHMGWFDGEARKLAPLTPRAEAERMADMAGGTDALVRRAADALARGDHAWTAQLASYALRLEPGRAEAKALLADALQALGEAMLSTSGRNYLLSCALELRR